MFFQDVTFRMMQSGLDALALEQKMILQNLANVSTPGYQAKAVSFSEVLDSASIKQNGHHTIRATVTEEHDPMRPDENTVDADRESLKLYQNYVRQLAMYNQISDSFSNMRYVFNQFTR